MIFSAFLLTLPTALVDVFGAQRGTSKAFDVFRIPAKNCCYKDQKFLAKTVAFEMFFPYSFVINAENSGWFRNFEFLNSGSFP